MGRPKGSTNKVKKDKPLMTTINKSPMGISFDLPAITCLSATLRNIREAVEKLAIEESSNKNCIPVEIVIEAFKRYKLEKWIENE
jgi:hypothetical protein